MAQQLLENRTPQAYQGVEAYARKHAKDDAGPLAWIVVGYAHYLDKDYVSARSSWVRAKSLEPLLGDYLAYMQALAYQGENNHSAVLETLDGFDEKYPDSLQSHDAAMLYASALMATSAPQRAAAFLEKHRQPVKSDIEVTLARAYLAAGDKSKASDIFHKLYFEMPTSAEAEAAAIELRNLGEMQPAGTFDQRHSRVLLLTKGRRFQDALNELSPLVEQAPPERMIDMQVEFAAALYRNHKRDDAQHLFESILQNQSASVDAKAQTLYFLAEIARDKDDGQKNRDYVGQLRTLAPESTWMGNALLSAGNMYLLRRDYETATPFYAEIYQRQKNGKTSPYSHWKTAWLTYRMGKKDEAKRLFEEQLSMYPNSAEVPNAIYWRGTDGGEEGDKKLARAYYQKLAENYRYFYYANLARERLPRLAMRPSIRLCWTACRIHRRHRMTGRHRRTTFARKKRSCWQMPRSMTLPWRRCRPQARDRLRGKPSQWRKYLTSRAATFERLRRSSARSPAILPRKSRRFPGRCGKDFISPAVLGRVEARLDGQPARSASGCVFDSAGVRVQSWRPFPLPTPWD